MSAQQTESRKHPRTFLYSVGRGLIGALAHTVMPIRYTGAEKLNRPGPWILISNHVSAWDPLAVAYPVRCQEVVFLGKKELAANPFTRWLMKALHMITVDRHAMDMEAMRACMRALKDGEVLGVFPEGTRHHEGTMRQMESGVALMALRARVPLVPVYVDRPCRLFRVTHVRAGEEIPTADLAAEGLSQETAARLMERIRETYRQMTGEKA